MSRLGNYPPLDVTLEQGQANGTVFRFQHRFSIGRSTHCDVQLHHRSVSRLHADVFFDNNNWWLQDNGATNGTFVKRRSISRVRLDRATSVEFSQGGPVLRFALATQAAVPRSTPTENAASDGKDAEAYLERYFGDTHEGSYGEHTMKVRHAYQQAKVRQRRRYMRVIVVVGLLFVGALAYAIVQQVNARKQRQTATALFYQIKELQVEMAKQAPTASNQHEGVIRKLRADYERYLEELGVYRANRRSVDNLIYRIAWVFGESEVGIPGGFVKEVKNYIKMWQSTPRLEEAILRARQNDYPSDIMKTLRYYDLPPHFFYLALQESNLDVKRVGPITDFGHAKGMWQFIPKTAIEYGLKTGPLVNTGRYDPDDERHDFEKSTEAAARYLRFLYGHEAQASGLLAVTMYNWGNASTYISRLPENPADRNFWQFWKRYRDKLPDETYDYIFYIFSAAVIGEDPQWFDFDFQRPLGLTNAGAP